MRVPGLKTLRHSGTWLRSRFNRHALILGYHRVTEVTQDPYRMCVSPENFSAHLDALELLTSPTSLAFLVQGVQTRQFSEKSVVITLDDGYGDLLQTAVPMLKSRQIHATVFIVTGFMGRVFWWDRLENILFSPDSLPEHLNILIAGVPFEWHAKDKKQRKNTVNNENGREKLLLEIYAKLRKVLPEERERTMDSLEAWIGPNMVGASSLPRALTEKEVIRLSAGGGIEIGSHSTTHPWLVDLPSALQRREIHESKAYLENILGRPITSLSYPNGSTSDRIVSITKQAGYQCACMSDYDIVCSGSNLFRLPRFWVPNWNGPTFERWLRKWI